MKNWEKDLKRYQLSPPPPKMTLQEYILKYLESGEEIYLRWFLHAVEPKLNQTASAMVQHRFNRMEKPLEIHFVPGFQIFEDILLQSHFGRWRGELIPFQFLFPIFHS